MDLDMVGHFCDLLPTSALLRVTSVTNGSKGHQVLKAVTISIPAHTFIPAIAAAAALFATYLVRRCGARRYADGYIEAVHHVHRPELSTRS